jgi:hypothetical protein
MFKKIDFDEFYADIVQFCENRHGYVPFSRGNAEALYRYLTNTGYPYCGDVLGLFCGFSEETLDDLEDEGEELLERLNDLGVFHHICGDKIIFEDY